MFFMISATEMMVEGRWEVKTISYSVTTSFGFPHRHTRNINRSFAVIAF